MPPTRRALPIPLLLEELGANLLLALVYFLLARLAAFYASDYAGNAMAIWPASGVSLAALLVYGYRLLPGAGLGSFCYNLLYFSRDTGIAWPAVSGAGSIALGSMLEFLVAGYLIKRNFFDLAPETFRDVGLFSAIAALSGAAGAAAGCLGLTLAGQMDFNHSFVVAFTWWIGDTTGILVVTPLLLVWSRRQSRKGLLFPLVAPCIGLTLIGYFIVHQFEIRLMPQNGSVAAMPAAFYHVLKKSWISWNVLFGGATLSLLLGVYLDAHRREQNALRNSEERLKRQSLALSRIALGDSINSGDLHASLKIMTETTAATLQVERASIWLFNADHTELHCADLYELSANRHSTVDKLSTADFPSYFSAVLKTRNLAIDDVSDHPGMRELRLHYLPRFNITSLMDAKIQFGNELIGVICHEHVGPKRHWTPDEQYFSGSIADLASLAYEAVQRKAAEDVLRTVNQELEAKIRERTADLNRLNADLLAEVAERRQAEEILRESELRLRLATKAADIGVWDWNIVNNKVTFTPEYKRQLGYEDHEIAEHYLEWESRLHPEDKDRAIAENFAYIEGKSAGYASEFRLRHKNGSYLWIHSRGEAVAWDANGRPTRILGCHVDITRLKEMEKQLLQAKEAAVSADRTKSMFIATMSHELRTPLNAIIGFTGILLQGLSGELNERQYDQLSRVSRSAKHLLDLITDIIDISKIEAGRIDVYPSDFDLCHLIGHAVDTVKSQAQEKNLSIAMNMPEALSIHSDRKRVLQCIINLLSNAIKYTEKGGVSISAQTAGGDVLIDVQDTGIGIEADQLQRLFIPFERLDSFLRLRTSGTGLGLYLTRKIAVDLLAGDVSVVSKPGTGSRFTLRLAKHLNRDGAVTG
jgi:PAS domain S-box-containing protein